MQPIGQETDAQLVPLLQVAMQLQESVQSTSPHAFVPAHWTTHARSSQVTSPQARLPIQLTVHLGSPGPPQSTSPQALVPTQFTVQAAASPHSMLLHAFGTVQEMLHAKPAGHLTTPQVPAVAQLTVHCFVARLQPPLHAAGHAAATQNPAASSQVRGGSSAAQS